MNQTEMLALAGLILSLVISLIKTLYKAASGNELSGSAAFWLSFILSFLVAGGVLFATGSVVAPPVSDPLAFAGWLAASYGIVFAAATTLYKVIISKESGVRSLGK